MVKTVKKNESNGIDTIICDALSADWFFLSRKEMGVASDSNGTVGGWYQIYFSILENKIYVANLRTFNVFFERLLGQYKNHLHGKRSYVQDLLFVDLKVQFNFWQTYIQSESEVKDILKTGGVKEELSAIVKANLFGLDYKNLSLPALEKERIEVDNSFSWNSKKLEQMLQRSYYQFRDPINTLSILLSFKGEKTIDFYSKRKSLITITYLMNNILKPNICAGMELHSLLKRFDKETFVKNKNFIYFDSNFEEDLKKIPQSHLKELLDSVPLSKLSPKKIAVIVKIFGEDFFDKKAWAEYGKDFLSIGLCSSDVDFSDKIFDLEETDNLYLNREQFVDLVLRMSGVDSVYVSTFSILCDSDSISKVIPYIIDCEKSGRIKKINVTSEEVDVKYPIENFEHRLKALNLFDVYDDAKSILDLEDYLGDSEIKKFLPLIKKLKESVDLYNGLN